MISDQPKVRLLLILSAVFIACAVTAELISSKVFVIDISIGSWNVGSFPGVVGILPWPVVFLVTDVLNEFYGKKTVRFLSILTCFIIALAFIIVSIAMEVDTILPSPTNEEFSSVFGMSRWIIAGSIAAFLISQLIDSMIFWLIKRSTGDRWIWLRSTGSTVVSQLIDSFVVLYIGFVLPGKLPEGIGFIETGMTNYVIKLLIAVGLTPVIYLMHWLVRMYLGKATVVELQQKAAGEAESTNI
jgi:uncharacterized integral membrane protein (TIGR00697 family)